MKNFLAQNWLKLLLAAIIVFLLIIVFRRCSTAVDNSEGRREVDSLTSVINQQRIDHTVFLLNKNRELDSIRTVQFKTELDAAKARQELNKAIRRGNDLIKASKPETKQAGNFDSLAVVFEALSKTAEDYITLIDTLTNQYQSQLDIKDSIVSRQEELLFNLRNVQVDITGKYLELEKDYLKSEKRRKRNNTLNRILAGALIVTAGIAIAK